MTSPTQLKYLEAMGIPVWVSRVLIIEGEIPDHIEDDELPCADSAQDLLDSLEIKKESTAPSSEHTQQVSVASSTDNNLQNTHQDKHQVKSQTPQQNEIGRTEAHTLYASGSLDADWIVIGQSPDGSDSSMNQPYPHESGELLNNMLCAVGVGQPRVDSYWINILKSPIRLVNENELSAAIELNKQLTEIIVKIKPKMVLIVGQIAAQNLLQSKEPLARIRLQQHKDQLLNTLTDLKIPSIVTYYPSYLLSKPQDKAKAWEDLKLAMKVLSSDSTD